MAIWQNCMAIWHDFEKDAAEYFERSHQVFDSSKAEQAVKRDSPTAGVTKSCSGRSGPNLKISRRNPCSPFFSVSYSINRHKIL